MGEFCLSGRSVPLGGVRLQNFYLDDLAQSLFPLPQADVLLVIVKGEVLEQEHLLGAISGDKASEKISVAHGAQVFCLQLELTSSLLDLERILAADGKLGVADLALGVEDFTLTRS